MSLITKFGVDCVEIREDDFYRLPKKAVELIKAYGEPMPCKFRGFLRFRIAEYRWDEINAAMTIPG